MNRLLFSARHLALDRFLSFVVVAAIIASCTPDEPVISSFEDRWRLLASDGPGIALYGMPDGNTERSDVWSGTSGISTNITEFRDQLYILPTTDPWIVVLDRVTLVALDTINMDTLGVVSDMAFANATTAYAVHYDKSLVSVIDITTNQVVRIISVANGPRSIAALGNQLAVACALANVVQIIDSRTNAVEATIDVPPVPYYIRSSTQNSVFVVVGLGNGKLDSAVQTASQMTFINPTTRAVITTIELTGRPAELLEQYPRGLIVTPTGFAYVPVQTGLLRVNARTRAKSSLVLQTDYSSIAYNGARAELLLLRADGPMVEVWDELAENQKSSVTLRAKPGAILGLPR